MRGGDSTGLRAYNERKTIAAIRDAGALSKAEVARATGLSSQAAAVIVNALVKDELLVERDKVRGQVGKPSTPVALNPDGAYALGIKIGRRSVEAVLADFCGEVVIARKEPHDYPHPDRTMKAGLHFATELMGTIDESRRTRVVGLGIAMPWDLHEWSDVLGLEPAILNPWKRIDVEREFADTTGLPVSLYNDATASCAAEMIAGDTINRRSALYIYLGAFIGGGVVTGSQLYRGEQLNAGALGPMPMPVNDPEGKPQQLLQQTSVIDLERALASEGLDVTNLAELAGNATADRVFEIWMQGVARAIAWTVISALSVIDFEQVVLDGNLGPAWRRRTVEHVRRAFQGFNRTGLSPVDITTGSIGPKACVLGATLLPLIRRFSPDTNLLVKPASS